MPRHVSLFAGVDAIGIAASCLGYTTTDAVEPDAHCRAILRARLPDWARLHTDVRRIGVADLGYGIDLLSAGFPCQDLSTAGRGEGLSGARSGLWFEFLRVIRECEPRMVLIENVAALRTRGLAVVVQGLAGAGYGCWWDCVPALAVGAPHLRDRIWITAVPFDDMPELALVGPTLRDGDKMPRAGCSLSSVSRFAMAPQAAHRMCKEAAGAVKREDGSIWLTALDSPLFPTPTARDWKSGAASPATLARNARPLNEFVRIWTSPLTDRGGARLRSAVADTQPGPLNPDWVEWLMGLPIGWTDPACSEPVQLDWLSEHGIPRTTRGAPLRKQRLMACGNSLVWQVAYSRLLQALG